MDQYYPISHKDVDVLVFLCNTLPKNPNILETGCGRSTDVLRTFGKVHCVDINETRLREFAEEYTVCDTLKYVPTAEYDLIFIDDNHIYTYVKHNILSLRSHVKKGGILCGHDMDSNEYDEAFIHEDCVNQVHHGVVKAVKELVPDYKQFPESTIWYANC